MKSFINFYFEFEHRKHRTIKRDVKLRSRDAIVSRNETIHPFLDTMHTQELNQKISVGVGSSDLGSEVPTLSEVLCFIRQRVLGQLILARSEVPTLPSEVPSSFR